MSRKIFRKGKKKEAPANAVQLLKDRAAMKIAFVIECLQNGFANFLNTKTKHFSARTWKTLIIVFGAGWGLLSTYIVFTALMPDTQKQKYFLDEKNKILFNAVPKNGDSLLWMEKIYDTRKSNRVQQHADTINKK